MTRAARVFAGFVGCLGLACGAVHPAYADAPHPSTSSPAAASLSVSIDDVSPTIRVGKPLEVAGTITNPGTVHWLDAQVYLQISPDPATTEGGLDEFAAVPDSVGFGTTLYGLNTFDQAGNVPPGQTRTFTLSVPYSALPISGQAGIYRVGVKVVAGTSQGRDPTDGVHTSTLVPLLPADASSLVPAETLTLLPITAPVKRLDDGRFADDSLATSLSFQGRLYDVLAWALSAPPDTVQIVVDPALLVAVEDMSHGYRVKAAQPPTGTVAGKGQQAAIAWLNNFTAIEREQYVMVMPWGAPAANALLDNQLAGPVVASVSSSAGYLADHPLGPTVTGWLPNGSTGIQAVTVLHHAGAGLQIVSQASLPALDSHDETAQPPPSLVDIEVGVRRIPALVTATDLAGLPTTATTSALQFRQRLVADATVRSMAGDTDAITVTALPFSWDPGPTGAQQSLASAFALPVVVAQSAIGAADRPATRYDGPVRPLPGSAPRLGPDVLTAISALHFFGGVLADILVPKSAEAAYQQELAMAGSSTWSTFPQTGAELITAQAAAAHADLAKVTVTGPPFVAMSSDSGRFPLTVTNGLDEAVTVRLVVTPDNGALKIAPLTTFALPGGQRRDIQVVSTATGSGVTSVRAKLATPEQVQFGRPWTFDVRATQIGLVIWVVMGVGGAVLFIAAGYRIVNRLRGNGPPRRQPT